MSEDLEANVEFELWRREYAIALAGVSCREGLAPEAIVDRADKIALASLKLITERAKTLRDAER